MNSLKSNTTRFLLLLQLTVFSIDMVYAQVLDDYHHADLIEMPYDAEEEKEKTDKEKEMIDRLISRVPNTRSSDAVDGQYFEYDINYSTVPREIVTPPPERTGRD